MSVRRLTGQNRSSLKGGSRAAPVHRVVQDAQAWVAGLRGEVESTLAAFSREHADRSQESQAKSREALERIFERVGQLKLEVAELLPALREARAAGRSEDLAERRDYIAEIIEWVDEVRTTTNTLQTEFAAANARTRQDVADVRAELFDQLNTWCGSLRDDVAALEKKLHTQRMTVAKSDAAARQAFLNNLRREVAEMRRTFRGGAAPRPARAAGGARLGDQLMRAAARLAPEAIAAPVSEFVRSLRERATATPPQQATEAPQQGGPGEGGARKPAASASGRRAARR